MKIIIDAMGGDNAPAEIVKGAVRAKRELGVDIVLTGIEDKKGYRTLTEHVIWLSCGCRTIPCKKMGIASPGFMVASCIYDR